MVALKPARTNNTRRICRRASQSHPPPDVQPREGSGSNSKGGNYGQNEGVSEKDDKGAVRPGSNMNGGAPRPPKNTEAGERDGGGGGWRALLRAALRLKEEQAGVQTSAAGEGRQLGQPSKYYENETLEVNDGHSRGSRVDVVGGVSLLGGGVVTGTSTVVGRTATTGEVAAPRSNGDNGQNDCEEGRGRQPAGGQEGRGEPSSGNKDTSVPRHHQTHRVGDANRGEESGAEAKNWQKKPGSQERERAYGSEDKGKDNQGMKGGEEEVSPSFYRPVPSEFWASVEQGNLSANDLEGILNEMPEEDAERFLRERGMVDKDGNLSRIYDC